MVDDDKGEGPDPSLPFKRIAVIGLGYIGLPTAATLALRGIQVVGVDINENVVESINRGNIHIDEPELDIMVASAIKTGTLRAAAAPERADAFMVAVPTPLTANREPDLNAVRSAADSLAPVLEPGNLIVLESTVPVGTTEDLSRWLSEERPDLSFPHSHGADSDIRIAYCPERVLPGKIVRELTENDRIIGGVTPACAERASALYDIFVQGRRFQTAARTAEMVKLTENAYRDVNIAFANELSLICDREEVNVWELIELANRHPRVSILSPGCGVGGHCIAIDPWFIVSDTPDLARLIRCGREVNDSKATYCAKKILANRDSDTSPIALAGLSFKPDVADMRESPALNIAFAVAEQHGGLIYIVEPNVAALPERLSANPNVRHVEMESAVQNASLIAVLVRHRTIVDFFSDHENADQLTILDFVNAIPWRPESGNVGSRA